MCTVTKVAYTFELVTVTLTGEGHYFRYFLITVKFYRYFRGVAIFGTLRYLETSEKLRNVHPPKDLRWRSSEKR